ncbi:hypothetical protein [Streptomyces sp. NPDC086519]|uniref:hypothetical protein n=1 Tax=Streptomyces sp. NPDC086519 TaxID=3154863 RepID=UPI003435216A
MRTHARPSARRRRTLLRIRGGWSRFLAPAALATATALAVTGAQLPAPAQPTRTQAAADTLPTTFDPKAAERVRQEQCLLDGVLRKGGPAMKEVARAGLLGTEEQLHTAADPEYWNTTALSTAFDTDKAAADAKLDELSGRRSVWQQSLAVVTPPPPYTYTGFQWVADKDNPYNAVGLSGWCAAQFWKQEDDFYANPHPLAGKESVDAAAAVYNARYSPTSNEDYEDRQAWASMQFMHGMYADDARLFLQYGGFPTVAPAADSMEFRIDVENLKARFASCAYSSPPDPHQVLGEEIATAHRVARRDRRAEDPAGRHPPRRGPGQRRPLRGLAGEGRRRTGPVAAYGRGRQTLRRAGRGQDGRRQEGRGAGRRRPGRGRARRRAPGRTTP